MKIEKKTITNNILFIRGIDTDNIETCDTYSYILIILSQNKNNNMTYFNYNTTDDIRDLYKKLCKTIHKHTYTHLIGHSMGGGLLMKYISEHSCEIPKYNNIILLMPLLYKSPFHILITKIPFIRNIIFPKIIFNIASKIRNDGNILNDDWCKILYLRQIYDMFNYIMLDSDDFVNILNKHQKNTVLFYAKEEALCLIPQETLDQIDKKEYVDGLHECFNGLPTAKSFFKKFLRYI